MTNDSFWSFPLALALLEALRMNRPVRRSGRALAAPGQNGTSRSVGRDCVMSTSRSSRTGTSIHPTRQQLEELDALLQRMLELPVNQVEETQAEPPVEPAPMTVRLA